MKYLKFLHEYAADLLECLRNKELDKEQKSDLLAFTLLLVVLLYVLFCCFAGGLVHAQERQFRVTETQLNALDRNLTTLETYNEQLLKQDAILKQAQMKQANELNEANVTISRLKEQATILNEQVQQLKTSLDQAEASLKKYENAKPKNKAIGIGYNLDHKGWAVTLDYHQLWLYHDSLSNAIGYKVRF